MDCHEPWQEERAKLSGFGMTCTCGKPIWLDWPDSVEMINHDVIEELISRLSNKDKPKRILYCEN